MSTRGRESRWVHTCPDPDPKAREGSGADPRGTATPKVSEGFPEESEDEGTPSTSGVGRVAKSDTRVYSFLSPSLSSFFNPTPSLIERETKFPRRPDRTNRPVSRS